MKKSIVLAALMAAAPFAAVAGAPSYNYVEAGYLQTDIDDLGDGDGVAINGSVALNDMFHLFGGYSAQQGEDGGVDVDLDQFRAGVGFRHAISDRADLLVRAAYERQETEVSVDSTGFRSTAESDGFSIETGYRGYLFENLDAWALVGYSKLQNADVNGSSVDTDGSDTDEVYGRLGAQLQFNPTWGLVGEGMFSSDVTQVFVGVRASF
ncbi:MAG: outer membrane beta-barrel protein [Lysobacter sp.]